MNVCKTKGFTLIEMLLVVALLVSISALTIPIGLSFFRAQILSEASNGIISALRESYSRAVAVKTDSSYGVRVTNDSYVLFRGDSYNERIPEYDETFHLPGGLIVSGLDEIVFAPVSGTPSSYGVTSLSLFGVVRTVSVNEKGLVE